MSHLINKCDSVLVIPVIIEKDKVYFVTVHDKKHQEWTFISGTVEKNETCNDAVIRELYEETRGCLSIERLNGMRYRNFQSKYKIKNKEINYKVYVIDINNVKPMNKKKVLVLHEHTTLLKCFKDSTFLEKQYNENDDMAVETLNDFMVKHKWKFMDKILRNQRFKDIIRDFTKSS